MLSKIKCKHCHRTFVTKEMAMGHTCSARGSYSAQTITEEDSISSYSNAFSIVSDSNSSSDSYSGGGGDFGGGGASGDY